MRLFRVFVAIFAEFLTLLKNPALMIGWLLALLLASWSSASPVIEVLR